MPELCVPWDPYRGLIRSVVKDACQVLTYMRVPQGRKQIQIYRHNTEALVTYIVLHYCPITYPLSGGDPETSGTVPLVS
jgi:hypothetical protein